MKTKLYCVITLLAIFALSIRGEALTLESFTDRERSGFFLESNGGITGFHTVENPHPDIDAITDITGGVSGKLGYFLSNSIGVYLGTWGSVESWEDSIGNVGVVLFSGDRDLTPYLYAEFKTFIGYFAEAGVDGNGVGIGGGIPIHRWFSLDASLSLFRRDIGYYVEAPTGIPWYPYTLDYRIGERTDVIITLSISLWLY